MFRHHGEPAQPGLACIKLKWLAENDPDAVHRAATLLMPKDWINFRLTGLRAQDATEASLSFLMDWRTRDWSDSMCDVVGVERRLLPDLREPGDVLSGLLPDVAGHDHRFTTIWTRCDAGSSVGYGRHAAR